MSPICTIIFLVSIFALSSASTSPSLSRLPISNSNLIQNVQKSTNFCYSNTDCENSQMGLYSTCVSHSCTCDFAYQKVSPSEKCTKIRCSYDSECVNIFSHSRCDITESCVCEINYKLNTTTAQCEKKDCTYDSECSGVFTRCNDRNKCVCDFGYSKDSYGNCISTTSYIPSINPLPAILTTVGIGFLLIIIGTVGVLMYRRKQRGHAGRVLQSPVATVHQAGGVVGPGMGHLQQQQLYPGQPGFNVQVGYQPAPVMYPGNVQSPPPYGVPSYSQAQPTAQTHPQQQTSDVYPNVPKM